MELEEEWQEPLKKPLISILSSSSSSSAELVRESNSMVSATLGRVMNTLLKARPKKLEAAISRLDSAPKIAPLGVSLEQSLWFLHKYVRDIQEEEESLDQVLVPMIEHFLQCKDSKNNSQPMILLNWLFHDEVSFRAVARSLVGIISRKNDHYISLGWCILARSLLEYEITMNKLQKDGIREQFGALLKLFSSCIRHCLSIISNGSVLQGGFELPTRLSVAAADFFLSLSLALTRKPMAPDFSDKKKASVHNSQNRPISLSPVAINQKKVIHNKAPETFGDMETERLLWVQLDGLIILIQKLIAWSRKSRPLHMQGLERVYKWLLETKQHYNCFSDEADLKMLETGALLLSSCWKHYGVLLHLEDPKFSENYKGLLEQYVSGIQYYADNYSEDPKVNQDSGMETLKFFLNCVTLLLGRLDSKQFETAISDYGSQLSEVLMPQLHLPDEEVVDATICILKAAIFKAKDASVKNSLLDLRQIDAALTLLLPLLDERDGAAKAVVKLVAECCSIYTDSQCMHEILQRLSCGNISQRRNAADVISDIIHISSESANIPPALWQELANHLLKCLRDEESVIRTQASGLLSMIDPSLVLPELIRLIYSLNETVQSTASTTFKAVLRNHNQNPEVICMLLDCLSKLSQTPDFPAAGGGKSEGDELNVDRVLKLLSDWSSHVEDWNSLIGQLMDKIFAEPTNPVIVRFLSHISEYLADAAHLVFSRLLLYTRDQSNLNGDLSRCEAGGFIDGDTAALFCHLCPLLIIRVLPLRVFDNLNSPLMYGQLLNGATTLGVSPSETGNLKVAERGQTARGNGCLSSDEPQSVAALLMNRALSKSEFGDVRKVAAELCGRIHPDVLIPIFSRSLEDAANERDVLKIKACLFSLCASLMIRGKDSYLHVDMLKIRSTLEAILLWPSTDGDDVSKAQHGCIDCLAWMLCAEVQCPEPFTKATSDAACDSGIQVQGPGGTARIRSVCTYVVSHLTRDTCSSIYDRGSCKSDPRIRVSFRLCMANVLISTCQKISDSGRKALASKIIPCIIQSIEVTMESEIKAACVQILFSMVYHLKSAILPYSTDLLRVALSSLRDGSQKEKMAGAKLLASLMSSEEAIVGSIAGGLLGARAVLQNISSSDPSRDVREICKTLLMCITTSSHIPS